MVKKLIGRLLLLVIPVFLLMASINYAVDPAQILHFGAYEKSLAQELLAHHGVVIVSNYDERKLQRFWISALEQEPDGAILGSSRVMSLSGESLGFSSGLNNGVSGATIEDIIAVVSLYEERDLLPQAVAIGVDPWLFNENHGDTRYLELTREYNALAPQLGLAMLQERDEFHPQFDQYIQAISPSYFQESVKTVLTKRAQETVLPEENLRKLADGSIVYGRKIAERTWEAVNETARTEITAGHIYQSGHYTQLSPKILAQFEALIAHLQGKQVEVIFVLSPLHPLLYAHMRSERSLQACLDAESYVRQFAQQRNIPLFGTFDPTRAQMGDVDFYDSIHPKRESLERMLHSEAANN